MWDGAMTTYSQANLGLSAYYDKRRVLLDGIHNELLEFGVPPAPSERNRVPAQLAVPVSICQQVSKKVEFTIDDMTCERFI